MSDKLWHTALRDAEQALRECEYDFDVAHGYIEGGLRLGGNGRKDIEVAEMALDILEVLETWLNDDAELKKK